VLITIFSRDLHGNHMVAGYRAVGKSELNRRNRIELRLRETCNDLAPMMTSVEK
jgi:hypothetical protein